MDSIDVYSQYFEAEMEVHGFVRHGALVKLIVTSGDGNVKYDAAVAVFNHLDEEDYAVAYDAYYSKELYNAPGIRSKAREVDLMMQLRGVIDELLAPHGGVVFWHKPLQEARRG